ncbi:NAD(P)H-dependent oxidoreductase [Priestia megaterium]|uniref:NAD(P)H-dependent oxidoreductase n=1 Tax=Priestia megaterium TaxID=1404 RepID=UPI0012D8E19D|nr:SAF domain-containing protein [Priestia megaterium]MCT9855767.1 SAF domain-containing protein [Priestia megaterium]MDF1962974.1 SAF domain-containing protein [Priestia megaterium]MUL34035.1 Inositol 2-dehydrogenase/D-chiro-inositol 3-dehydrogenase [Priestia megaterium]
MLGLNYKLRELEKMGREIRVGLIGCGQMGRGMISQIEGMKGMRVVATADLHTSLIQQAYLKAGINEQEIVLTGQIEEAEQAIEQGKVVGTVYSELVTSLPSVDVVVDATGVPNLGAEIAWKSILNKKHIVMLNVEADVTVGPLLKQMADASGVVYTGSAGDEPGAVMEIYDFADAIGFEIIALGKGKNNPLNHEANPSSAEAEARAKGASPKMIASFQDGTKTMVEMNAVANATGFLPDKPGMHGPSGTVKELPSLFQQKEKGGILSGKGIVDYVNGVAPGVFAVISSDKEEVHHEMNYLKMGDGPNYVLYRPYHLTSLETPLSVARAYFHKEATIAPWHGLQAETVAVAKKDLKPGDRLDGIGGYTVYGKLLTHNEASAVNALPIGLVDPNVVVTRSVKQGEIITYGDIEQEKESMIWKLRSLQEQSINKAFVENKSVKLKPILV